MRTPVRRSLIISAVLLLLSAACILPAGWSKAYAALPTKDAPGDEVLITLLPEAAGMQAPAWLKEGLRVYYKTAGGELGRAQSQAVAKLSEAPLRKPEDLSVSPLLVRTDVTGIDGKLATTFSTVFIDLSFLPWEDESSMSSTGMGPFWINVELLKDASEKGLKVEEVQWKILNQSYDAVKVSYSPADGPETHYAWIVEKSTGLLLYSAKISRAKPGAAIEINAVEFYSMRYMGLPWSATGQPAFVKPGFTLVYDGNIQTWNPKTGPGLSVPALISFRVDKTDKKLVTANLSRVYSAEEKYDSKIIIGTAQIGGSFWMPQSIVSKFKVGQVLDKDPITNSIIEVSYIGETKDGTGRVVIFEFGKNYKRAWAFRASDGLLVYWMEDKVIDPVSGTTQKAEWTLK